MWSRQWHKMCQLVILSRGSSSLKLLNRARPDSHWGSKQGNRAAVDNKDTVNFQFIQDRMYSVLRYIQVLKWSRLKLFLVFAVL